MLAVLVKGVLLFGILGWYSTGVWKIIDGYFKERFEKYLQEEYAKNPKMEIDIHSQVKNEKVIEIVTKNDVSGGQDYCDADECPVGKLDPKKNEIPVEEVEAKSAEKIGPLLEKEKIKLKPPGKIIKKNENCRKIRTKQKKIKSTKKPTSESLISEKKKKRKLKILTLNDEDFEKAKIKSKSEWNDDFYEFDYEDEKPPEGIPVSELGFKPRADIAGLDRVTADEFCPISLDDNRDCLETKTWP